MIGSHDIKFITNKFQFDFQVVVISKYVMLLYHKKINILDNVACQ